MLSKEIARLTKLGVGKKRQNVNKEACFNRCESESEEGRRDRALCVFGDPLFHCPCPEAGRQNAEEKRIANGKLRKKNHL